MDFLEIVSVNEHGADLLVSSNHNAILSCTKNNRESCQMMSLKSSITLCDGISTLDAESHAALIDTVQGVLNLHELARLVKCRQRKVHISHFLFVLRLFVE